MARPTGEAKVLQERIDNLLPRIQGESPVRAVKVVVQAGEKEGSVNVRFMVTGEGFEPGSQRVVGGELAVFTKWPDLALADFLARNVKELTQPEK